jgi:hypothetical protein
MSRPLCPHCHQPLPSAHRWGIYLTPMQTVVLDTIRDNPGITTETLLLKCSIGRSVLRVCVHNVNTKLEETGVRIGQAKGDRGHYRIMRRSIRGVA